jgi:23S rRNA (uracil1939-C5)-methyltransferase
VKTIEGVASDLAASGEGVVAVPEGTFLVRGALPGERVRFESEKKAARLLEVVEPSPERVSAVCADAEACGGCPLMIASPALARRFKRQKIARATGIEPEWIEASRLGYRRRARLAFDARRRALGYRGARSRDVVSIATCHVLDPRLERARSALAPVLGVLAGAGEIALDLGASGPIASIVTPEPQSEPVYRALEELVRGGELGGLELRAGGAAPAVFGDVRSVSADREGRPLFGPALGFAQANDEINRALVDRVVDLVEPGGKTLLELYAGAGNLTVALAPGAKEVVAVERDAELVTALRENLKARALEQVKVVHDDAERAVLRARRADVVVLDPPRTGAREVVRALPAIKARVIVYVSCDAATLARDAKELASSGYEIDRVFALDMFPQTAHVEAIARFVPSAKRRD